jgi:hypothetical protein
MGGEGLSVTFYEDYPYVELEPGGIREAQARFGARPWRSETVRIDIGPKIVALRGYQTQIGPVFGSEADLARRVREFCAQTAYSLDARERLRRWLAPSGRRLAIWRRVLGWHAYAERVWTCG